MEQCPFILIPHASIHPHYISIYNQVTWINNKPYRRSHGQPMPKINKPGGVVSNRAVCRIKKAINWLLLFAVDKEVVSKFHSKTFQFKLSFTTLTLASKQIHSDNEIKAVCLNQFLTEARKKWNVKDYLWRAESQSNGNIHFHFLCDKFIPWSDLRDTWNRIQNKLGYVDRYREEMKAFHAGGFNIRQALLKTWSYKSQLRAYRTGSKKDWNSPNSTDIHSVKKIKDLPAYLSKYCTKNDERRKIEGKLWGLSTSLSCLKGIITEIEEGLNDELKEIAAKYPSKVIHKDYFSVIMVSYYIWSKHNRGELYNLFRNYIHNHRHSSDTS